MVQEFYNMHSYIRMKQSLYNVSLTEALSSYNMQADSLTELSALGSII